MDNKRDICLSTHRRIRRLAQTESPYAGVLVSDGDRVAVAVSDEIPAVSGSWNLAGAEHVSAPRDIAMTEAGAEVLMPWCAEEVSVFLGRRAASTEPLTNGEITTLVISLLRGLTELDAAHIDVPGVWWLSDEVRPVLVLGSGESAVAATRTTIEHLSETTRDRACGRLLAELLAAFDRPRALLGEIVRWEREFLQVAASKPLRAEVLVPVAARHLDLAGLAKPEPEKRTSSWRDALAEATTGFRERVRMPTPAASLLSWRPRPAVLAAILGGGVLLAGLLWPDGSPSEAAIETPAPIVLDLTDEHEPIIEEEADATEYGPGEAAGLLPTEPEGALAAVLARITSCEDPCSELVAEGAGGAIEALQARAESVQEITLIDDYGDLSVVRLVTHDEQSDLIVVLARVNELWLVRDIYDAADQPE